MMFTKESVLEQLNRKADELKQNFTVSSIGLFGSLARNEATSESDVDILVDFTEPTFDHYMDLKFHLEALFDRSVDLVIADSVKPRLKPVIDKEVIYAKGL
jgi:predicted nucleotidyltransferase